MAWRLRPPSSLAGRGSPVPLAAQHGFRSGAALRNQASDRSRSSRAPHGHGRDALRRNARGRRGRGRVQRRQQPSLHRSLGAHPVRNARGRLPALADIAADVLCADARRRPDGAPGRRRERDPALLRRLGAGGRQRRRGADGDGWVAGFAERASVTARIGAVARRGAFSARDEAAGRAAYAAFA